ncbi:hypothetical protein Sste5346_005153 [Sporothrix stenoceras]|uniref:FHA domain-containing protein n=1 Tax=Sporothrix stenoceras TaxID=5173 RepID=A0ABR3Z600_9PEZI
MWLLENAGNAFEGRRLWLRPGKRYLFGRTRAEPGQLVISDKTISRKHLTIEVAAVRDGEGSDVDARSQVTVEDLATKIGTVVNGTQIRGTKHVLTEDRTTIKMGHMADLFTISWQPVVFSFSFTSKELRLTAPDDPSNPWTRLKRDLEPLDVKFLAEFRRDQTTHVVAKKRNTSRGLQALVSGAYIVTDSFLEAVTSSASDGSLESDWDAAWPNALDHLPPRGDEPSNRPSSTYGPDPRRANIFEGYTFVFYDQKQYDNLLPPISQGRGKAILLSGGDAVVPRQTEVDDFVRYVKGVAGEQGMGEFEDGSAGRGVVVVRYVPAKGDHVAWFTRFTTAVALRLDHRLIDQREFLDAILAVEPSMLRRPLEVEATPAVAMDMDVTASGDVAPSGDIDEPQRPPPPSMSMSQLSTATRRRGRRGVTTSRFKGFDADLASSDIDDDGGPVTNALAALDSNNIKPSQSQAHGDEDMFMSQQAQDNDPENEAPVRRSKRGAPASQKQKMAVADDDEDDVMDDIAPTAAAVKRRRIEAGHDPVPRVEDSEAEDVDDDIELVPKKEVAIKKEMTEADILDQARRNREAAEQKLAAERARLAELPDDGLDAEAIRKLTLVETIEVRKPAGRDTSRTNTTTTENGGSRWNPEWNGRRNFKKFRRQGDVVGRPPPRVIVGLEPAKTKEYGIGDGYWLEGRDDREERPDSIKRTRNGTPAEHTSALLTPSEILPVRDGRSSRRAPSHRSTSIDVDVDVVSVDAPSVDVDVVPDTDPEDGDEEDELGFPASPQPPPPPPPPPPTTRSIRLTRQSQRHHTGQDNDASLSAEATTSQPPSSDLPRTRAGKVGARTAAVRQSQATASQTRTPSGGAGGSVVDPSSMTSSSLVIFDTPPDSTQASTTSTAAETRNGRGSKRQPAAAAAAPPPAAKRPRRGAAAAATSSSISSGTLASGSTPAHITINDSDDEDDGLKFKFRSRR